MEFETFKTDAVYGAVIGDVCGSAYEKSQPNPSLTIDEVLANKRLRFTDDTVLTIAMKDALDNEELGNLTKELFMDYFWKWGNRYRNAGFSSHFKEGYIDCSSPKYIENHSSANGSIMRASPLIEYGYTPLLAEHSIEISHCSHDAKIAILDYLMVARELIASKMPLLSIQRSTKIWNLIPTDFIGYMQVHSFDMSAIGTLRDAYTAIINSNSFEETILNSIRLGGDTDTIAAVAGSLAAIVWKIPQKFYDLIDSKLTGELKECLSR